MDAKSILQELKEIGALSAPAPVAVPVPVISLPEVDEVHVERADPSPSLKDVRGPHMVQQIEAAIVHLEGLLGIFQSMRETWMTNEAVVDVQGLQRVSDVMANVQAPPSRTPVPVVSVPSDLVQDPSYAAAREAALAKIRSESDMIPAPPAATIVRPVRHNPGQELDALSHANRARPVTEEDLITVGSLGTRTL